MRTRAEQIEAAAKAVVAWAVLSAQRHDTRPEFRALSAALALPPDPTPVPDPERLARAQAVLDGFNRRREDAITRQGRMFGDVQYLLAQNDDRSKTRLPVLVGELQEMVAAIIESYVNDDGAEAKREIAAASGPPPVADAGQDAERGTFACRICGRDFPHGADLHAESAESRSPREYLIGKVREVVASAAASERGVPSGGLLVELETAARHCEESPPTFVLSPDITPRLAAAERRADAAEAKLVEVERERGEALKATADWRHRMVDAEINIHMREHDAELEKAHAERDRLAADLAVERGRLAALIEALETPAGSDSLTTRERRAYNKAITVLADLDAARLAHDERVRAEGLELGCMLCGEKFERPWVDYCPKHRNEEAAEMRAHRDANLATARAEGHAAGVAEERERAVTALRERSGEALVLIAEERAKQIQQWGAEHDAGHRYGDLAVIAAVLAVHDTDAKVVDPCERVDHRDDAWGLTKKHADPMRRMVVAGALIAAEIDRLAARIRGAGKDGA